MGTKDTVMDTKLFGIIGLRRLLCRTEDGGYDERTRKRCLMLVWLIIGYYSAQFAWLYDAVHDVPYDMYTIMMLTYSITCAIKGHALVRHAIRLGSVMDACRFSFTTCGARRPAALRRCRDTVSRLLRVFVVLMAATFSTWAVTPLVWPTQVSVALKDGTVAHYRSTVFSMWFPLPQHAHNSLYGWVVLYAIEVFSYVSIMTTFTLFDCYLITIIFGLDAQFRNVSASCQTLGRRFRRPRSLNLSGQYRFLKSRQP